jgi:hypothetical protein
MCEYKYPGGVREGWMRSDLIYKFILEEGQHQPTGYVNLHKNRLCYYCDYKNIFPHYYVNDFPLEGRLRKSKPKYICDLCVSRENTIKRCLVYKEELMMATWHPDRRGFITWCFDIENCKDIKMRFMG